MHLPRLNQTPKQLLRILEPQPGEHFLEIGPGIGTHAVTVASRLGAGGSLAILDVQQQMLEAVVRRGHAASVRNISPRQGDATHLPYPDRSFDGAYLIGVVGEIRGGDAALRELSRVVKPNGRVVIGEALPDPDFVPLPELQARAQRAGLILRRTTGCRFAYLARFEHQPPGA